MCLLVYGERGRGEEGERVKGRGGRKGRGERREKGERRIDTRELSTGIEQMGITWKPSDALGYSKTSRSVQSSAHSCNEKRCMIESLASLSGVTAGTAHPRPNLWTERVKE